MARPAAEPPTTSANSGKLGVVGAPDDDPRDLVHPAKAAVGGELAEKMNLDLADGTVPSSDGHPVAIGDPVALLDRLQHLDAALLHAPSQRPDVLDKPAAVDLLEIGRAHV